MYDGVSSLAISRPASVNFCCHDLEALDKSNPLAEALMTMLSSFLKFLFACEGEEREGEG